MKNIRVFLSENFQFLEVNFSINLNRRVFVMIFLLSLRYIDVRKNLKVVKSQSRKMSLPVLCVH